MSRLAQSFEHNYGDFIPILRPILRDYLKICKEVAALQGPLRRREKETGSGKHYSSKSKYRNVAVVHVTIAFRGDMMRSKREGSLTWQVHCLGWRKSGPTPFDPSHVSFGPCFGYSF